MSPALEPGDRILIVRHVPVKMIKRGQIAIFIPPIKTLSIANSKHINSDYYIKRIVGLPEELIFTHISDLAYCERSRVLSEYDSEGIRNWNIPAGHYFLKGDSWGTDSQVLGPIPFAKIMGIMVMKLPIKDKIVY